jgi:MerR family Zn(II)-responsive transcriptional regulator of zntA
MFKIRLGGRMITIGKLAALAEVSTDTLRYYEREGLIEPASKSAAGYRLYDKDSARRIRFIKQAQHCGFTLAEIGELLVLRRRDTACCGDVRKRAIEKKLQLENKIRSMKAMSKALDRLIADCADETQPIEDCRIIASLEQVKAPARAAES